MRRLRLKAPAGIVADYFRLFVNRRAYTVQSNRPQPETGRHSYYRPTDQKTGEAISLTQDTIRQHIEGEITIGLYAINPQTQRCKWIAIDADYREALEDLLKLGYYLQQDGVYSALEMSKRGGHLWIFLQEPLLARDCRIYVCDLAQKLGVAVKGAGLPEGIEVFPKHDALKPGEFGNAIRGPLGIHRGAARRFWFYGADYDLEKQMAYLKALPRVSAAQLARLIEGKSTPPIPSSGDRNSNGVVSRLATGREFRILDHITTKVRRVGRNYVTRCPSCAESGHDRSGDNLAIAIDDARKYICWAGCTKEMIRAALGCPIRVRKIP